MDQRLREAWHAREQSLPINPVLHFAPAGLVLGAGTVLVPAQGVRRLTSLDGQEARVLALLSAGRSTFSAQLEDDVFRGERGRIVGRVLPDGTIAIDTAAVSAELVQEDEPKLCPAPGPDRPGGSERGRD
jgi:hypothetical protein